MNYRHEIAKIDSSISLIESCASFTAVTTKKKCKFYPIKLYATKDLSFGSTECAECVCVFEAHMQHINILKCSPSTSSLVYLLSTSYDTINIWNLSVISEELSHCGVLAKVSSRGDIGSISCGEFDSSGTLVALGVERDILLLYSESLEPYTTLKGHRGKVTDMKFLSSFGEEFQSHVISISEDRTIRIWDLQQAPVLNIDIDYSHSRVSQLIYKSSIICAASLTKLELDPMMKRITVGNINGEIRMFEIEYLKTKKENDAVISGIGAVYTWDLEKHRRNIIGSYYTTNHDDLVDNSGGSGTRNNDDTSTGLGSNSIIFIKYLKVGDTFQNYSVQQTKYKLLICTHEIITIIDPRSYRIELWIDTQTSHNKHNNMILSKSLSNELDSLPSTISDVTLGLGERDALIMLASMFSDGLSVIKIVTSGSKQSLEGGDVIANKSNNSYKNNERGYSNTVDEECLNIIPHTSLDVNSPLNYRISNNTDNNSNSNSKSSTCKTNRKTVIQSKAVTFHRKISSSGYGSKSNTPWSYTLKAKGHRLASKSISKVTRSSIDRNGGKIPHKHRASHGNRMKTLLHHSYNINSKLPCIYQSKHEFKDNNNNSNLSGGGGAAAVLDSVVSQDGMYIAACYSDHSCRLFYLPVSKFQYKNSEVYLHHNAAVSCINWNSTGRLLLSSSCDGSAAILQPGRADPALVFDRLRFNTTKTTKFTSNNNNYNNKSNPLFRRGVIDASFIYMDKFIILGNEDKLFLYSYSLENIGTGKDDLTKLRNESSYKLVHSFTSNFNNNNNNNNNNGISALKPPRTSSISTNSSKITSLSCVNQFLSRLVITSHVNRWVSIWDLNSGKLAGRIPSSETHSKYIQFISFPTPSPCVNLNGDAYNTFLTSGSDSCVKVWDLRSLKCSMALSRHVNSTSQRIGSRFSPCMRYIASGSEDGCVYVYDMRMGALMQRIKGARDVVCHVTWNPCHPQLISNSYDGKLRFYNDA